MKISTRFEFVDGDFNADTCKLICVGRRKYGEVHLCFKGTMNVTFAQIKLHSRDRAVDADAVFDDAMHLGNEICRRWNEQAKDTP